MAKASRSRLHEDVVANLARVRRFAYALCGAPHAADDLVQTTAMRTLANPPPAGADVSRWMLRVCRNLWIDELRAKRVRGAEIEADSEFSERSFDGEADVTARIDVARVNAAMNRLSEEQRAVIALVALEGCSYKEAAAILDLPIGTVMSRLSRARAAIAAALGEETAKVVPMRKTP